MTFRPTWRDRFVYLLIVTICAGLVAFCGYQVTRGATSPMGTYVQPLIICSILLGVAITLNAMAYAPIVRVTDAGLEWKDGKDEGRLAWNDIRGVGFKRYPKFVKPGLVLRSSDELKFLPFFSPALYAGIQGRCGRLPAEVERELGFRD